MHRTCTCTYTILISIILKVFKTEETLHKNCEQETQLIKLVAMETYL